MKNYKTKLGADLTNLLGAIALGEDTKELSDTLNGTVNETFKAFDEKLTANEGNEKLQADLGAANAKVLELQSNVETKTAEIETLQASVTTKDSEITTLTAAVSDLTEKQAKSANKITSLTSANETLEQTNKDLLAKQEKPPKELTEKKPIVATSGLELYQKTLESVQNNN